MEETIVENSDILQKLSKKILKNLPPREIAVEESALLILSRTDLTQRGYKNLKQIMKAQKVILASYSNVQSYLKTLDIGKLKRSFCNCPDDECLSVCSDIEDSLRLFLSNDFWKSKLVFPSFDVQKPLFEKLKSLNENLYGHLDCENRTLFLRLTGDNFRAACKQPTEQISYSLLNNHTMLHSPYGQIIDSLWRGSESRLNIEIHTKEHFESVKNLLNQGITIGEETFNVLPILCADLSFVKEIVGKCSSTSLYGCLYCKKKISSWDSKDCTQAERCTMEEMFSAGCSGEALLGRNPDHSSKKFKDFQQNNFGQYVSKVFF